MTVQNHHALVVSSPARIVVPTNVVLSADVTVNGCINNVNIF